MWKRYILGIKIQNLKSLVYIWDVFVWSGQVIRGSLPEIYHSNGNSGLPAPALVQHRSVSLPDETVCPCLETHCRHYRERNQRASWYILQSIIILQCWILLMCNFWCDLYMLSWIFIMLCILCVLSCEKKVGCFNLSLR